MFPVLPMVTYKGTVRAALNPSAVRYNGQASNAHVRLHTRANAHLCQLKNNGAIREDECNAGDQ